MNAEIRRLALLAAADQAKAFLRDAIATLHAGMSTGTDQALVVVGAAVDAQLRRLSPREMHNLAALAIVQLADARYELEQLNEHRQ